MVVEYAPVSSDWNTAKKQAKATYEEYSGKLYYKADVTDLTSGTKYTYRVGDTEYNKWSEKYSFETETENVSEFSFIGISDTHIGYANSDKSLYKDMIAKALTENSNTKFIVNIGDMVNTGTVESQWQDYFKAIEGYKESIPHMAVVGNHELSVYSGVSAGKYYTLQFNNPDNAGNWVGTLTADELEKDNNKGAIANYRDTVYSFDYGNAHFVVLNSGYSSSDKDIKAIVKQQLEWLKTDLASSDAKWKIVMLHQGLYGARSTTSNTRELLEPIVDDYGVDLVLQGHDHFVMRTYPMKNGEIVTKENPNNITKGSGVIYNVLGASGSKRYEDSTKPDYSVVHINPDESFPTYTTFKVSAEKIEVVTKQINGVVIDSYTITE